MSLNVITKKGAPRDFYTYDLEWIPGKMEVRMAGVYDGETYRCYRTIEGFLKGELTYSNRGKWYYAHAGGLADFQFLLETLIEQSNTKGWEVKCAFSGSSAIIVQVTRGKNSWHFVDSYWLLRDKLENIAKWVGLQKLAEKEREQDAREYYATADFFELMTYNEQDCVILYKAIESMQEVLLDLGGQLQKTLASSAMYLFRSKFLTRNIKTNWGVNERAQEAYFASRVEIINENCYNAEYYDINSSFPYAMTQPCPGEFLGTSRRLPDEGIYIADVTIEVPECYLPPIPMRLKNRLFFPTGSWRSWLCNTDIQLLQKTGCRILRVWETMHFAEFNDLAEYATTLYEMRKAASTDFERTAFKLLLNSLYGKFAEAQEKSSLHINPSKIDRDNWEMLFPGAWLYEKTVPVPHRHVPISAHITSLARKTIFEFMDSCAEVHYCDTDGFSTTEKLETSNELGDLKLEKRIRHGHFVQPKVYRLEGTELQKDGSWKELGDAGVKAKGFSRMNIDKFMRLLEGETIAQERMTRIKENARRNDMKPKEHVVLKRLQQTVLGKRFHYPDGSTRPWQVKELSKYFTGNRKY